MGEFAEPVSQFTSVDLSLCFVFQAVPVVFVGWPVCSVSVGFQLDLKVSTTRWWSEPASAPRLTLTSSKLLLHFLPMVMWSIWFSVLPSGDVHVVLWIRLCWNTVPPMTRSLKVQNSASSSPFSFWTPTPCK